MRVSAVVRTPNSLVPSLTSWVTFSKLLKYSRMSVASYVEIKMRLFSHRLF